MNLRELTEPELDALVQSVVDLIDAKIALREVERHSDSSLDVVDNEVQAARATDDLRNVLRDIFHA